MKIVKLNAIDSTNTYLKDLIKLTTVENWTVIVTDNQVKGKGQFDNKWISDKGKNLTFSILVKFESLKIKQQFYLNYSVSIALYNVLRYYIPEKLTVKWPNDILSANHKICGILIESSINNSNVNHAIIGIGLIILGLVTLSKYPNLGVSLPETIGAFTGAGLFTFLPGVLLIRSDVKSKNI